MLLHTKPGPMFRALLKAGMPIFMYQLFLVLCFTTETILALGIRIGASSLISRKLIRTNRSKQCLTGWLHGAALNTLIFAFCTKFSWNPDRILTRVHARLSA